MHILKIHPHNYEAIARGEKRHEVRKADRSFQQGDRVVLREWDPDKGKFTGRDMEFKITNLTAPGTWGLPESLCVFTIQ